ncbi:hypothetical protein [Actinopolymorpha sp. B9G3]|uniref:hypothetical protein n=1 Tax=Actinopolymorpha sp. B9G3 TaxID=3158970 RepID=UPI0032D9996E
MTSAQIRGTVTTTMTSPAIALHTSSVRSRRRRNSQPSRRLITPYEPMMSPAISRAAWTKPNTINSRLRLRSSATAARSDVPPTVWRRKSCIIP